MKKILLTLVCVLAFAFMSMAQTKVYAEIVGDEFSGAETVKIEFGKNSLLKMNIINCNICQNFMLEIR